MRGSRGREQHMKLGLGAGLLVAALLLLYFQLCGRLPTRRCMGPQASCALGWDASGPAEALGGQVIQAGPAEAKAKAPGDLPRASPPLPSIGVVVARHSEDISWIGMVEADLNATVRRQVDIVVYETPNRGPPVKWPPPREEAERVAASGGTPTLPQRPAATWQQQQWWQRGGSDNGGAGAGSGGVTVSTARTPINRGNEAMAYLSFIIDNYDVLPELVVFLHAHRHSNHTHLLPDWTLKRLARHCRALPEGFMATQCKEQPTDWGIYHLNDTNATEPGFRRDHMSNIIQAWEEEFGRWLGPLPDDLLTPPNAEFVVTRDAIRSRPLEFYRAARRWVLVTPMRSLVAAMTLEYLWQITLTGRAVAWASQEECLCRLYGVCTP